MSCSLSSERGTMGKTVGRIARGLAASICAGFVVAWGSVVLSVEPSGQDSGKQAGQPAPGKRGPNRKQAGRASDPKAKGQAKAKAARKQTPDNGGPTGPLPERPARVVTPPSMTPADLDGLIKRFLARTAPKVEPATLTSDVEFVRRIYFDVIGHPPTPMQVEAFLHDHGKDKRARLIETLLRARNTPATGPITGAK